MDEFSEWTTKEELIRNAELDPEAEGCICDEEKTTQSYNFDVKNNCLNFYHVFENNELVLKMNCKNDNRTIRQKNKTTCISAHEPTKCQLDPTTQGCICKEYKLDKIEIGSCELIKTFKNGNLIETETKPCIQIDSYKENSSVCIAAYEPATLTLKINNEEILPTYEVKLRDKNCYPVQCECAKNTTTPCMVTCMECKE